MVVQNFGAKHRCIVVYRYVKMVDKWIAMIYAFSLLDFKVEENLDGSAPEKYLESLALLYSKKYQLFN